MKTAANNGTIIIRSPDNMFVLRLLNEQLWEVGKSSGEELNQSVPAGWYIARCEVGGPSVQKTVRVEAGKTLEVVFSAGELPMIPSSAPIPGTHQLLQVDEGDPTEKSEIRKSVPVWKTAEACFVISVRNLLDERRPVSLKGFMLLTDQGEVVKSFQARATEKPKGREASGCDEFVIMVPAGAYLLQWPADPRFRGQRRIFPIWISGGWMTSVFMGVGSNEKNPDPASISVHMSRMHEISKIPTTAQSLSNSSSMPTELALASLRTGRRQLNDQAVMKLVGGKFDNPMGGILGAYMLCQRKDHNWDLFDTVLTQLEMLVPNHPDLRGLLALALNKGYSGPVANPTALSLPDQKITFPPMQQAGTTALSDYEWKSQQKLIEQRSIAELASLNSVSKGLWTTFTMKPFREVRKAAANPDIAIATKKAAQARTPHIADNGGGIESAPSQKPRTTRKITVSPSSALLPQFQAVIRKSIRPSALTDQITQFIGGSGMDDEAKKQFTMNQLRRMGYSVSSANEAISEIIPLPNSQKGMNF